MLAGEGEQKQKKLEKSLPIKVVLIRDSSRRSTL